jgi:hypothetical protein
MAQNKNRKRKREQEERSRHRKRSAERRARAEARKKLGITPGATPLFFREYYLPTFLTLIKDLRESGQYDDAPSPERWSFWQHVPAKTYPPQEAAALVSAYLAEVNAHIRAIISKQSMAYWLHVTRRLAPMPIGEDRRPATILHTRDALDAAVQKWATFAPCDRVAKSTDVDPSAILRGDLVATNDRQIIEALSAQPQLVLTDFGRIELLEVAKVEKLAYETWRSMAQLRATGKGAELVITGQPTDPLHEHRSGELDYLLRNYDQRVERHAFDATATGTVFHNPQQTARKGHILLPRYNVEGIPFEQLRSAFEHWLKMPVTTARLAHPGPNFIWWPFDLLSYYEAHRPLSDPFRDKHKVSLESVLAVIATLSGRNVGQWAEPSAFWHSWQRAYEGPVVLAEYEQELREWMPSIVRQLEMPFDPAEISVTNAVQFLTLTEGRRTDIGVEYRGPHYVFLPFGADRVFVDCAHLLARLYHLFHGTTLSDQNFKGDALEAFTRRGRSVLPEGELRAEDGTSRQIDAGFGMGDLLVIGECRAKARSMGVERGQPQALTVRQELVEHALDDVDEKAKWLASHPVGRNYDIRGYQRVLPVAITPFREFIPSRDAKYWISPWLPRVLTADELLAEVERGSLPGLAKDCPNVVTVEAS